MRIVTKLGMNRVHLENLVGDYVPLKPRSIKLLLTHIECCVECMMICGREGFFVNEHTSHSFNIKNPKIVCIPEISFSS